MEFSNRDAADDYAAGDDDEEKMEEFFAILRRFRRACADRNRFEGVTAGGEGGRPAKRRKVAAAGRSSWVPKFEWEDFNTAVEFRRPVSADSPPAVEFRGAVSADMVPAVVMKKENTEEINGKVQGNEEDGKSLLKLTLSL